MVLRGKVSYGELRIGMTWQVCYGWVRLGPVRFGSAIYSRRVMVRLGAEVCDTVRHGLVRQAR